MDEMSERRRVYKRACEVHLLWKVRFGKILRDRQWDDDEIIDTFFDDLRRLQYQVQSFRKLPKAPKAKVVYPEGNEARSVFIMKNENIGPVCLPLKTGTTNWQKALGAVYLHQMDPSVVIDSSELQTTGNWMIRITFVNSHANDNLPDS